MVRFLKIKQLEERIAPSLLSFGEGAQDNSPSSNSSGEPTARSDTQVEVDSSGDLSFQSSQDVGDLSDLANIDIGGIHVGGVGNGNSIGNDVGQVSDTGNFEHVGDASVADIGNTRVQDAGDVDVSDTVGDVTVEVTDSIGHIQTMANGT